MIRRKLFIIIMGIFLVICAGSCNIYPLYLKIMMDKFNLSLKEVNLYGSSINMGLWVALPMGWVYDRFGPKISCIIGAITLSGTYMILFILMNSSLTSISIFPLLLIGLIMGQGSALCYTCSVTTNLKNFRFKESSCIVGLIVANLAISPSIFTTYREFLTDVQMAHYFLIISIFLAIVISLCGFVFRNLKNVYSDKDEIKSYEKYKEKKYVKVFILINLITLIIYTFGVIFNNINSNTKFPNVVVYPCLQLLNFIVLLIEYHNLFDKFFFKEFIDKEIRKELKINNLQVAEVNQNTINNITKNKSILENKMSNPNIEMQEKINSGNLVKDQIDENKSEEFSSKNNVENQIKEIDLKSQNQDVLGERNLKGFSNKVIEVSNLPNSVEKLEVNKELPLVENSINFVEVIKSKNIIVLFLILFLGIGSMIANLNNIEFIVKSINFNQSGSEIFEFVILYFAFNSFFRIISGIILDKLIKANRFYHFIIIMSFVGLISQLLGIFMQKNLIFLSISLAGATHGGYMTFTPVYVRTEFGTEHMGKILGFLTTGCALGSLFIADLIFTIFYDSYAIDDKCIGKKCYYPAYIISSIFLAINCVLSVYFLKLHPKNIKINSDT